MKYLENKKIAFVLILISLIGMFLAFLLKEPYSIDLLRFYSKNNMSIPLSEYYVDLFFKVSLKTLIIIFVFSLAAGIYFLFYKDDQELRQIYQKNVSTFQTSKIYIKSQSLKSTFNRAKSSDTSNRKTFVEKLKITSLILGIICLISYFGINDSFEKEMNRKIEIVKKNNPDSNYQYQNVWEDKTKMKILSIQTTYQGYSTIFSICVKIFALGFCLYMSKYIKGHWLIWAVLGFALPYVGLILAGLIPTKNEYR